MSGAPPRIHDMSAVLGGAPEAAGDGAAARRAAGRPVEGSAQDLTPSSFYARSDAERARDAATFTVRTVEPAVLGEES